MITIKVIFSVLTALFVFLLSCEPYVLISCKTAGLNLVYIFFASLKYIIIIVYTVTLLLFRKLKIEKQQIIVCVLLFLFFTSYMIIGLLWGNGANYILYSIKYIYSWIFLLFIFYLSPITSDSTLIIAFRVSVFAALINFVYSVTFDMFFFHNLKDVYFYKLYTDLGMFSDWNVIREGKLRYFGLVGSNLTLSQFLLIPISYLLASLIVNRKGKKFLCCLILGVLFFFLYKTAARNSVMALAASLTFLTLNFFLKPKIYLRICLFCILYLISFFAVIIINTYGLGDPSSVKRIFLLYDFWNNFTRWPLGYGIGAAGISIPGYKFFYESAMTTLLTDAGIFGIIFLLPVILVCFKAVGYIVEFTENKYEQCTYRLITYTVAILTGALLFMTNFTNIFDNTLYLYSLIIGVFWKIRPKVCKREHSHA